MAARISHTTIDCTDAYGQSVFWGNVLSYTEDPDDPNEPGDTECRVFAPDGSQHLLFIEVPEPKSVKNRIHFDLRPTDVSRDEELPRLLALGATLLDDRRQDGGFGWYLLADPEGNEFCLLRLLAD